MERLIKVPTTNGEGTARRRLTLQDNAAETPSKSTTGLFILVILHFGIF